MNSRFFKKLLNKTARFLYENNDVDAIGQRAQSYIEDPEFTNLPCRLSPVVPNQKYIGARLFPDATDTVFLEYFLPDFSSKYYLIIDQILYEVLGFSQTSGNHHLELAVRKTSMDADFTIIN
jgi:hypothetical protein